MILFLFILLTSIIGVYSSGKFVVLSNVFLFTFGYFFLYIKSFSVFHTIFFHPSFFLLAILFSFLLTNTYRYLAEDSSKKLLRRTMGQYLADDLVTLMLERSEEARIGGERKDVVCFFSDIEGFTSISETKEPEEIMRFLGVYLKEVSDVIIHHKGFINKYEGDAVMELW